MLDGVAALVEVVPALVVDGDGGAGSQQAAQVDGLGGGHGVTDRSGDREAHTAVQDGVPGDPQGAVPPAFPGEGEAGDLSGERSGQGRAEAAGAGRSGQDGPGGAQDVVSGPVEVVAELCLCSFAGRPLLGPQPGTRPVATAHRDWHTSQVFHGTPRPAKNDPHVSVGC
ncbi:hypothetical protein [Streptomyces sp. TLI_55]|uniref:hypothetical protein n=1 Tax=Streptomyces sp. TLI_55 TaxID=1938861 RepID=UPI0015CF39DB|nr:hypothetical protein [Streptomyces sp. TLI_55]